MDYIVKVQCEKGVTVLISSHQLHEIEEICDYFLIVQNKHVRLLNGGDESKIIIELGSQNEQLKVNIENSLNLNNVEKIAKEKLGMQKLTNRQTLYVSLPKRDYVEAATEEVKKEEDKNWFQKIVDSLFNK